MKTTLLLTSLSIALTLSSCGGGSSDSGGPDINLPDLSAIGSIPGARIGSEFVANSCITNELQFNGNTSTSVTNSCSEDVNVREILTEKFGPVYLIKGNTTRSIPDYQAILAACFSPKVPGGVAEIIEFQCL